VLVASLALAGCSGANVDDLFRSSGGSGGAGGTGSTTGKGATSTSGTGNTSGTTTGVTSTSTGPTTTTTGPGPTSTSSGPVASSSTGMPDPTVDCGAGSPTCSIANGGCCWSSFQLFGSCSQNGGCPGNATQILCQLPSDCPGQICCANRNSSQSPYDLLECVDQCDLPSRVVCDPMNPDCPLLPNGMGGMVQSVCKASQLLPQGYYVCSLP
jgi:hypothetical protein